jgi:hypothetical protein
MCCGTIFCYWHATSWLLTRIILFQSVSLLSSNGSSVFRRHNILVFDMEEDSRQRIFRLLEKVEVRSFCNFRISVPFESVPFDSVLFDSVLIDSVLFDSVVDLAYFHCLKLVFIATTQIKISWPAVLYESLIKSASRHQKRPKKNLSSLWPITIGTFRETFIQKQLCCSSARQMCGSSARQSHTFNEGIVAWRVISKQILLRV